jgi:hypothetical protein
VSIAAACRKAIPKSSTFARPSDVMTMFALSDRGARRPLVRVRERAGDLRHTHDLLDRQPPWESEIQRLALHVPMTR